jgi:hypothetical protein
MAIPKSEIEDLHNIKFKPFTTTEVICIMFIITFLIFVQFTDASNCNCGWQFELCKL